MDASRIVAWRAASVEQRASNVERRFGKGGSKLYVFYYLPACSSPLQRHISLSLWLASEERDIMASARWSCSTFVAPNRWTSEEAAHVFFQRCNTHFFSATFPTCEPFLLPPNAEIWPPRLPHHLVSFTGPAPEPETELLPTARVLRTGPCDLRFTNPLGDSARLPSGGRVFSLDARLRPLRPLRHRADGMLPRMHGTGSHRQAGPVPT